MSSDSVRHPSHYIGRYGLETMDVIKNFTDNMDGVEGYYVGNILKYICRWKKKNGYEDLCKAEEYLNKLKDYVKLPKMDCGCTYEAIFPLNGIDPVGSTIKGENNENDAI